MKKDFAPAILTPIILFSIFYFLFSSVAFGAGIVPCGGLNEHACTFCDLLQLVKNIFDFIVKTLLPAAVIIMVIYGGFLMMTAREKPDQLKKGRSVITTAIIGLVIALLAWLLIDTLIHIISGDNLQNIIKHPWNELKCQ